MHQILRFSNIKFKCLQKVVLLKFTLYTIENDSQNNNFVVHQSLHYASKYTLKL